MGRITVAALVAIACVIVVWSATGLSDDFPWLRIPGLLLMVAAVAGGLSLDLLRKLRRRPLDREPEDGV